jgi:hypothetical protein
MQVHVTLGISDMNFYTAVCYMSMVMVKLGTRDVHI